MLGGSTKILSLRDGLDQALFNASSGQRDAAALSRLVALERVSRPERYFAYPSRKIAWANLSDPAGGVGQSTIRAICGAGVGGAVRSSE